MLNLVRLEHLADDLGLEVEAVEEGKEEGGEEDAEDGVVEELLRLGRRRREARVRVAERIVGMAVEPADGTVHGQVCSRRDHLEVVANGVDGRGEQLVLLHVEDPVHVRVDVDVRLLNHAPQLQRDGHVELAVGRHGHAAAELLGAVENVAEERIATVALLGLAVSLHNVNNKLTITMTTR